MFINLINNQSKSSARATLKRILPALLIAATSTAATLLPLNNAFAETRHGKRGDRFVVYADVIRAVPIYKEVITRHPTQQCWTEQQQYRVNEGYSYHGNHRRKDRSNRRRNGNGDALVGGVIGGVIGNQIGRNGSNGARAGATIAGAIIGSVIAHEATGGQRHSSDSNNQHRRFNSSHSSRHHSNPQYSTRAVQRCETVVHNRVEQRIDGYNVTYKHRGRTFQTKTRKNPGSQIAIRLNVKPVRGQ